MPQIIGHEAISVVEQVGPDAEPYGFAVGAPLWHDILLRCDDCRAAGPESCPTMTIKGVTAPGYFAEYTLVDAASAVGVKRVGSNDSDCSYLAPLFCAGVTV